MDTVEAKTYDTSSKQKLMAVAPGRLTMSNVKKTLKARTWADA